MPEPPADHAEGDVGGPTSGSGRGKTVPTSPRRRTRTVWTVLALVLAVALAIGLAWRLTRPVAVEIQIVKASTVERVLAVVGRARPADLLDVRSPNPGQVAQLLHDDGDRVAQGEPLAIIKATVEAAQTRASAAQVRAAVAERQRAQLVFDRTKILLGKGFATRAAFDEARATLQSAQANLDAATATTTAAAELAKAYVVRAPMAGVVLLRPIDNGQVILPTTTLFVLGSLEGTEVQAQVDEAYADALHPGLAARAVQTGSDAAFAARVTEVSPQVDSATGGRLIKLVALGGPALAPGRSIDVTIVVDRRASGLVIPRTAVIDAATDPKIYVVDATDIVRLRRITILRWPSLDAIVEGGLSPGDRIVLAPGKVRPGKRVRPLAALAPSGG
ncbi:efflux RND transporter periplasmic adaptor subunit [Caulobacter sp. DWP3-1-3b2]|uniref:efflux RND transporter periplasmic adaptor subunit n=1 Tax=Caulobacter sp. DWP3-1-3b2 TaxID=2804643 RepID=UPI003CE7F176